MDENKTLALQRGDASAGAAAHMRPVWCAGMILRRESVERVPRNLEIPKTPGAPASRRVSTLATGNEFLSLLALSRRPAAGVVEVEDAFQIDSRDAIAKYRYIPLSRPDTVAIPGSWAFIPTDYNLVARRVQLTIQMTGILV